MGKLSKNSGFIFLDVAIALIVGMISLSSLVLSAQVIQNVVVNQRDRLLQAITERNEESIEFFQPISIGKK